jgi:hypothetical protein
VASQRRRRSDHFRPNPAANSDRGNLCVIHSYPPPVSLGSSQSAFAYGASVSALLAVNAKGGRCASELPRAAGCGSPHADPRVLSAEGMRRGHASRPHVLAMGGRCASRSIASVRSPAGRGQRTCATTVTDGSPPSTSCTVSIMWSTLITRGPGRSPTVIAGLTCSSPVRGRQTDRNPPREAAPRYPVRLSGSS